MFKKFLSVMIALLMVLSMMPISVFAEVTNNATASLTIVNNGSVDREYHVMVMAATSDEVTVLEATPDEIVTIKAGESIKYDSIADSSTYNVEQLPYDNSEYKYIDSEAKQGVLKNSEETFYYYTEGEVRTDITEDEYNAVTANGSYVVSGYYDESGAWKTDCAVSGSTGYMPETVDTINAPVISGESVSGSWIKNYKCTATYTYDNVEYQGNGSSLLGADYAKSDAINKAFSALSTALPDYYLAKDNATNEVTIHTKVDLVVRKYTKENIVTTADVVLEFDTALEPAPKGSLDINYAVINEDGKFTPSTDATFALYDMNSNELQTAAQNNVSLLGSGYTRNRFSNISAGIMPGTSYYVQQTAAPAGHSIDTTKYYFTVNRDGSVTAGDNSNIATTSLLGTVTNTLYNTEMSSVKLFTNEIHYEETTLVLTADSVSTTYNPQDSGNEAIKSAVIALIDEENSILPDADNRTYNVESKNILGVWGNMPQEPLDAGEQIVRLSVSAKGYYTAYAEVTVNIAALNVELKVNSSTITYGEPTPELVTTYPDGVLTATVFLGVNTTDSSIAEPYLGIVLPDIPLSMITKYPEIAAIKMLMGTKASVNDIAELLKQFIEDEATKQMIDTMLDYVPDSVKELTVNPSAPTEAGVYLTAALCVDNNYTSDLPAIGIYTIKPSDTDKTICWNTDILNTVKYKDMATLDYSATVYDDITALDTDVKYLWLVTDETGNVDVITDPSYTPDKSATYTQVAYVTGSQLINPIVRVFDVSKKLLGDANMSDVVDIMDATTIQLYLAKMIDEDEIDLDLANVDLSNKVDITDATYIQMYLAKYINSFEEIQ